MRPSFVRATRTPGSARRWARLQWGGVPGAHGAEDGGEQRGPGVVMAHAPGAEFAAGGVHQRHRHRKVPGRGDVGAEAPVGLAADDERLQGREDGGVALV
jgi:hypothetical protein